MWTFKKIMIGAAVFTIGATGVPEVALAGNSSLAWSTYLGGTSADFTAWPNGMALDGSGRIVVAGSTFGMIQTTPDAYDATGDLFWDVFVAVLDPNLEGADQLVYATYLGGNSFEFARAVMVDDFGRIIVAGRTHSPNFPVTANNAYDATHNGGQDGFLSILDITLEGEDQLVYSTFLGGTEHDTIMDVTLNVAGAQPRPPALVLTGATASSATFPTTAGAYDTGYNGGDRDAFVAILDPTLPPAQQLVASTFLGGIDVEYAKHVAIDDMGLVVVMGDTQSFDYPTTFGAYDTSFNGGGRDVFVSRLNWSLTSLGYSTFFGGTGDDNGNAMAVGDQAIVTFGGWTSSNDLPVSPDAHNPLNNGMFDGYVSQLNFTLDTLVASTYIGGSLDDGINGLSVSDSGHVSVVGVTYSTNLPVTVGAAQPIYNGGLTDACVMRFGPTLGTVTYCTFLGGTSDRDFGYVVREDEPGRVIVAGLTNSSTFETTPDAYDTTWNGGDDAYLSGLRVCPWDCGDGDGNVGIIDFLAMIGQWGGTDVSCDVDGDGVGISDFLQLVGFWGACP